MALGSLITGVRAAIIAAAQSGPDLLAAAGAVS